MKEIILGIIGVVVLCLLFPMVMTAIHEIQTEDRTDSALTRSDSTVILKKDLWQADTDGVLSAVDNTGKALAATDYVEVTRVLTLSGWAAEGASSATVTYEVDRLAGYVGFGALVGMTPLLLWLGLLGASVFGIYSGFKNK